jgi:RNA polymerase sigma-70 factor (ECF subfamily)
VDQLTRLALDAAAGDALSLEGFVRCSQADVLRLAALLVDRDAAEDVTQEVYLRAIPALRRYRGDAPARVWLLGIARRTCADVLRRRDRDRRRARRLAAEPRDGMVVAEPAGKVALDLLVAGLDEDRRTAFVLTQVLGLAYAEAAEVAGVPIGTIRSRVARAREDLVDAAGAAGHARRAGG